MSAIVEQVKDEARRKELRSHDDEEDYLDEGFAFTYFLSIQLFWQGFALITAVRNIIIIRTLQESSLMRGVDYQKLCGCWLIYQAYFLPVQLLCKAGIIFSRVCMSVCVSVYLTVGTKTKKTLIRNSCNLVGMCVIMNPMSIRILVAYVLEPWPWELFSYLSNIISAWRVRWRALWSYGALWRGPMFWASWHQNISTYFQPSFSSSIWKRGRVRMCKLSEALNDK